MFITRLVIFLLFKFNLNLEHLNEPAKIYCAFSHFLLYIKCLNNIISFHSNPQIYFDNWLNLDWVKYYRLCLQPKIHLKYFDFLEPFPMKNKLICSCSIFIAKFHLFLMVYHSHLYLEHLIKIHLGISNIKIANPSFFHLFFINSNIKYPSKQFLNLWIMVMNTKEWRILLTESVQLE